MKNEDKIEKARSYIKSLPINTTLCAFDIIGRDYLDGESAFYNDLDGLYDLIDQFELESNEIIQFLIGNENYNIDDNFIVFDGESLWSFSNLKYFKKEIYKKCNEECAEFILSEVKQ